MSSSNQSNAPDWCLAVALVLTVLAMQYETEIKEAVTAILLIGSAGMALLVGGWFLYHLRKGHPIIHSPTGCDVDLTGIERENLNEWNWTGAKRQPQLKQVIQQQVSNTPHKSNIENKPALIFDVPIHRADTITPAQGMMLERAGYHKQDFVPLGEVRRQTFYIRTDIENLEHTFVVHSIITLLKGKAKVSPTNPSIEPDVVFWHKGKEYALEVETPLKIRQKGRLQDMVRRNNSRFGVNWAIVVTKSAYAKQFYTYGEVLTRNQVKGWIAECLQQHPHSARERKDNGSQNRLSPE